MPKDVTSSTRSMAPLFESTPRRRLKRESSADQVAVHIRRLIISGEVTKGERLRQDEIAAELGVSRIPVREAIITLDREGWVRFEANRGAYVAGLESHDILDHFELRGLVFGLIARRVTEVATAEDVRAFVSLQTEMRAAADLDEFAVLNDRFISRLVKVARSPRLTAALMVTPAILPEGFFEFVPAGRAIQQSGYDAFVVALKARSSDKADDAWVDALRRQGHAVVEAFAAVGIVEGI
jgi:DNA-binding GntR family transcriptional regulator